MTREPLEAEIMFQVLSRLDEGLSDEEAFERRPADLRAALPGAVSGCGRERGRPRRGRRGRPAALVDLRWEG